MSIEQDIQESEQLIQWLDSCIDGLEVPANDRMRLAAGCLATALEHQKSIVLLLRQLRQTVIRQKNYDKT